MPVWFVVRQFLLNPLICGERGALGASRRCVNWNLDTTSKIGWGPLSLLAFTRLASTLSHCLSLSFFLIRWDFIRPPLSVTAIGCEISEGRACGNHSISCAHLAQHLYRRAGGFWKGEKSFTKSTSEAGLTQTDSGNVSYSVQPFLFASSLFCARCLCVKKEKKKKNLCQTVLAHCEIDLQRWEITFWKRPPFAWICWADMEKKCETW